MPSQGKDSHSLWITVVIDSCSYLAHQIECFLGRRFTLGLPVLPDIPIQFQRPCLLLPAALGLLALLAINNNSSPIDALPGRRFTFIKHVPANLLLLYDSTVGRPFKNKPKCHQFGSLHYVYNNNEPSLVHTMLLFLYIAFKLDFCYCPSNYFPGSLSWEFHGNYFRGIYSSYQRLFSISYWNSFDIDISCWNCK